MLKAIINWNYHQDFNNTKHSPPTDKLDLCKDYISMEGDESDQFSISFPKNCVFGHVLCDTNPLDDMVPGKEVVRPSKKPRSVGLCRSNQIQTTRKTTSNKKMQQNDLTIAWGA